MSEQNELLNVGNFVILLVSGAVIPLLLVLYKSRCKSICFGCIVRDVLDADTEKKPSLAEANKNLKLELKEQENNIGNINNEPETEGDDK